MLYLLLGGFSATLFAWAGTKAIQIKLRERNSPLRDIPGPPSSGFLLGNLPEILSFLHDGNFAVRDPWTKQYGPTLRYNGLLNASALYTTDLRALNHILMHSDVWQKDRITKRSFAQAVGGGVLIAEDETHKRQRRILNPAFGRAQIRDLTEIFISVSLQLRDIWSAEIDKASADEKEHVARIDVLSWLSRATMDVIGLAGFNYAFNSLDVASKPNELNEAFSVILEGSGIGILDTLQLFIPLLGLIPTRRGTRIAEAKKIMHRIGNELVQEAKARLRATDQKTPGRDLLSLLVQANINTTDPRHQLTDQEVLDQIPTLIVAGHETTSSAVTWALFALTQAPAVQRKLRSELFSLSTDTPTMDELNSLVYLDHVLRETLRLHTPVVSSVKQATKDDVLPLATPFINKQGVSQDTVTIEKGTSVEIPILSVNTSTSIWGPDAMEFIPERWDSAPSAAGAIPGVWGNMLTFLGGPHGCIGFQFSLVETKALLYTLVRAFEFELAVPAADIGKRTFLVQRPVILSDLKSGNQMPLLIRPYERGE